MQNPAQRAQSVSRLEHAEEARDRDLEDLIHAWKRLGNPRLKRLAIGLVRTLGAEPR